MQIITSQQILVPKKVYIGDQAELRCTFNSPDETLKTLTAQGRTLLSTESFDSDDSEYVINSVSLSPAGVDFYQLTITFVPWKTGDLQFPPMTIEGSELILSFQPVQIVSLISTDAANATTLHDAAAPLLLPGTAYKLYGALAGFIIFLIILIRLIIKRKSLAFYFSQKKLLRRYKKNRKHTIRLLRQIISESKNDSGAGGSENSENKASLYAERIQKILRSYLEVRFDYPFTRAVTSEISKGWQTATGGLLSDEKNNAFDDIAYSFIRTDFIRYSKNGAFEPGEIKLFIEKLIDRIETLEKTEKPEGGANA